MITDQSCFYTSDFIKYQSSQVEPLTELTQVNMIRQKKLKRTNTYSRMKLMLSIFTAFNTINHSVIPYVKILYIDWLFLAH